MLARKLSPLHLLGLYLISVSSLKISDGLTKSYHKPWIPIATTSQRARPDAVRTCQSGAAARYGPAKWAPKSGVIIDIEEYTVPRHCLHELHEVAEERFINEHSAGHLAMMFQLRHILSPNNALLTSFDANRV